jgi:hypothetical protein
MTTYTNKQKRLLVSLNSSTLVAALWRTRLFLYIFPYSTDTAFPNSKTALKLRVFIRIRMMADAFIVQFFHREQMRVSWRNPATSSWTTLRRIRR